MRAGAREAIRAEWIKLRTVRSTFWALLLLAGVSVLFSAMASAESHTEGGSPGHPGDNDIVLDSLAGIMFGQIAAAVLGVLAITSEYGTRLIRTTLAAVPRRRTVLAAKTAVVAMVVGAVGLATSITCFLLGQKLLQGNGFTYEHGYPAASLADGPTFRAVAGSAAYLALLALLGLGLGGVMRHTAGAITTVLALLLAPVIAISFLPDRIANVLEHSALMAGGIAVQQTVERSDAIPLGPWVGLGVVGLYAATALAAAFWLIARRDA
jgi:ABC-type transport system involved in multi-copper enzyme maturation permease subunit